MVTSWELGVFTHRVVHSFLLHSREMDLILLLFLSFSMQLCILIPDPLTELSGIYIFRLITYSSVLGLYPKRRKDIGGYFKGRYFFFFFAAFVFCVLLLCLVFASASVPPGDPAVSCEYVISRISVLCYLTTYNASSYLGAGKHPSPLDKKTCQPHYMLSLIHIWRCRRSTLCRSRWSPYH